MSPIAIAYGELLIDFVPTVTGVTLIEAPAFIKAPGGAPANVAVGLAKLGIASAFMGQVGEDAFGHFLAEVVQRAGVDISHLKFSSAARTALAFVSLKADGDRDFMFYRHPSADMLYSVADVDPAFIQQAQLFHYGSISLIQDPIRSATIHAAQLAQANGALLAYDPNLRLPLWPSAEAARAGMLMGWGWAHVIKVSEEELHFLTGLEDLAQAARQLWHPALRLLAVTHGAAGCTLVTPQFICEVPGFKVEAIDTTGSGDAFLAGLLRGLLVNPNRLAEIESLRQLGRYANAAGALTATRRGAIPALPTHAEVEAFLQS